MFYQEKVAQNFDLLKSKFYTVYFFYKKKIKYVISLLAKGKKERKGGLNIYLSKNEINGLEISVKVGCGLFCEYCPQDNYIKNYKSRYQGQPKVLSEETFHSVISNVPVSTLIKWTGFTEPLDSKYFSTFSTYLHKNKYKQVISTTLHGAKHSVSWFCENLNIFDQITLHLPDDSFLMKSRVDEGYLNTLSQVLENASLLGMKEDRLVIFLIGKSFQKEVGLLVEDYLRKGKISATQIHRAEVLNTRNSTIDVSKLNLANVRSRSFLDKSSNAGKRQFYCSYRRLNMGVLLPNGEVTLCSQDYNLEFILGDLKTTNLNDLYEKIETDDRCSQDFASGNFFPCTKCEHYKTLDNPFSGHLRR